MITSHRRAHRWIILLLSITLPALIVLGLADRPGRQFYPGNPVATRVPVVSDDLQFYMASNDLWQGLPVTTYIFRNEERALLYLFQDQAIAAADLLVYLLSDVHPNGQQVASGEINAGSFLGALSRANPARIELSIAQLIGPGSLVIYSQGKGEQLASVNLPLFDSSGASVR